MYQELVRYHSGRMTELFLEIEAEPLTPLEKFRRSLEAVVGHFNRHRDFMRIFHQEIGGECGAHPLPQRIGPDVSDERGAQPEPGEPAAGERARALLAGPAQTHAQP